MSRLKDFHLKCHVEFTNNLHNKVYTETERREIDLTLTNTDIDNPLYIHMYRNTEYNFSFESE